MKTKRKKGKMNTAKTATNAPLAVGSSAQKSRHYRPYKASTGTPEDIEALRKALSRLSEKKHQGN